MLVARARVISLPSVMRARSSVRQEVKGVAPYTVEGADARRDPAPAGCPPMIPAFNVSAHGAAWNNNAFMPWVRVSDISEIA